MSLIFSFASNFNHSKEINMSSYDNKENEHCCGTHFWFLVLMCWIFMIFAATSSALALGLLSFSQVDLEVLVKVGQPQIQKNAGMSFDLLLV
jgi:metal transporter CNNM